MSRSLIILLFALIAFPAFAQQDVHGGIVLLVQLRSENNRVQALKKAGKIKLLEEVQNDAEKVNELMITDFSENFRRCPVYYFMDTDAHKIGQRQFENVLFDQEGHIATIVPIDAETRFRIVYYGYPSGKTYGGKPLANTVASSGDTYGRGLVVTNEHFQQIGYHMVKGIKKSLAPDEQTAFYYHSHHFDISYGPTAQWLASAWDNFLRNRQNK